MLERWRRRVPGPSTRIAIVSIQVGEAAVQETSIQMTIRARWGAWGRREEKAQREE